MKRTRSAIIAISVICLLMGVTASAKVKTQNLTIGQEIMVGNTTVKPGTYRLSFDDQTNELTVSDSKSKEVIVKIAVRAEPREGKTNGLDVRLVKRGDSQVLAGIAFPHDNRVITVADSSASVAGEK